MAVQVSNPEIFFGCLRPKFELQELADELTRREAAGTWSAADGAEIIRRNRSVLVAERTLREIDDHPVARALLTAVEPIAISIRQRLAAVARSMALADKLARELGVSAWGIKGLASREGYPEPGLRELRDADLAVATAEEAFLLARALRARAFCTDRFELPWLKATRDGERYGQYKLVGPDGLAAIDVHFGNVYSTGHCGLLPVPPPPEEPGVTLLGEVANLRPMLGNSGGDINITVKDINDLWNASIRLTPADITTLLAELRSAGLLGHLAAVARVTLDVTASDGEHHETLQRLASSGRGKVMRPLIAARPVPRGVRVVRTAVRAYQQAAAHTRSHLGRAAVTVGAVAYYGASLRPRLQPLRASAIEPRPWRCVRLVPVSLAAELARDPAGGLRAWSGDRTTRPPCTAESGSLNWRKLPAGRVLAVGDSVFVPTVWFMLSKSLIGQVDTIHNDAEGADATA